MHPQGGPDTHDDPHETGAAGTAAQALFVQKVSKVSQSLIGIKMSSFN